MDNDEKCKYREICGWDFCMGEGDCPDFEEGDPAEYVIEL
jgi:hypothetical protein